MANLLQGICRMSGQSWDLLRNQNDLSVTEWGRSGICAAGCCCCYPKAAKRVCWRRGVKPTCFNPSCMYVSPAGLTSSKSLRPFLIFSLKTERWKTVSVIWSGERGQFVDGNIIVCPKGDVKYSTEQTYHVEASFVLTPEAVLWQQMF